MSGRIRVLVAAAGDGDRPAAVLSRVLRDAGAEVIYTAAGRTATKITAVDLVRTVLQEDVDAVALSVIAADAATRCAELVAVLRDHAADDVQVLAIGDLTAEQRSTLGRLGVAASFGPDPTSAAVAGWMSTATPR